MARFPLRSKRGDTQLPEKVRQVVETLPYGRIGVYILRDRQERVLCIGYSKDLRHRIADYFRAGATGWPSQVDSVEVILTDSEESAQSLERQLVNEHCPPYNDLYNPSEGQIDPVRELLVQARRNQILDAAAAVFAEKGFHRATTKEIAIAASLSEGTIYNYFASKDDLLIGIMTRLAELEHLDEELASALQSDARKFFIAVFRDRMGRITKNHEMLQAILPEILVDRALRERFYQQFVRPTASLLEQYIEARIELGHIRPLNVPLAVRAVQSMFVGLLVLRILGEETLLSGWDELPEVVATLIFDGLISRNGG